MKKSILLLTMFLFLSTVFAKTPEIVNPPRPHAKYKWLLVIEHALYPGHTHYLYTDKYHIFQEPDGWKWIVPEGRFEAFSIDKGDTPRPDTVIPIIFHSILLSYPEILKHTIFLRDGAPKVLSTGDNPHFNDPKKFMNFWTARAKKIQLKPKKAKVVFR